MKCLPALASLTVIVLGTPAIAQAAAIAEFIPLDVWTAGTRVVGWPS